MNNCILQERSAQDDCMVLCVTFVNIKCVTIAGGFSDRVWRTSYEPKRESSCVL